MSIDIQFLGAVGTVTGSQFLVSAGDRRVLVDCGMFQGSPEEVARNRLPFAFAPADIDAVLLTHAHLDHCGRLPALVRAGFDGPVIATRATVDLAEIVLRDSAKLQVHFAERWKRHHPEAAAAAEAAKESEALAVDDPSLPERLRNAPPEGRTETREPLYVEADVDRTMSLARGVERQRLKDLSGLAADRDRAALEEVVAFLAERKQFDRLPPARMNRVLRGADDVCVERAGQSLVSRDDEQKNFLLLVARLQQDQPPAVVQRRGERERVAAVAQDPAKLLHAAAGAREAGEIAIQRRGAEGVEGKVRHAVARLHHGQRAVEQQQLEPVFVQAAAAQDQGVDQDRTLEHAGETPFRQQRHRDRRCRDRDRPRSSP